MRRVAIAGLTVSDRPTVFGVARLILNRAAGRLEQGIEVDLSAFSTGADVTTTRGLVPEGASLYAMPLRPNHEAVPIVRDYLRRHRPAAVIAMATRPIPSA